MKRFNFKFKHKCQKKIQIQKDKIDKNLNNKPMKTYKR